MPNDLDHVRKVAGKDPLTVVTTTRPDGTIHASLVSAGVTEDVVTGTACVAFVARGTSQKLRHLRNSGRATAVFRHGADWVGVEGPVRLIGPDDRLENFGSAQLAMLIRRVFVAAGGTHQDWDEFDRVMEAEGRTVVFVTPERISGNS
ncbi:MAG: pyridoxamine 5'-phosphate oxidase family protein [Acidimicrobiales bacterium]|jgi:PPOX class probable F420-dependent enzyme